MSAFYDEMAQVAIDLLTEFGVAQTFTRVTAEVRNPATGAVITPGTTTTHSPMGVRVPVKSHLIDGTRIKSGDQMLIIDGTFEPLMSDKIAGWTIQEIESKKPADKLLVSFVRIRK
jgi:hypothetical protein